jgi:hypothetical protein
MTLHSAGADRRAPHICGRIRVLLESHPDQVAMRKMSVLLCAGIGLVALLALASWYSLAVPGHAHAGPLPPATGDEHDLALRLKRHVVATASVPQREALRGTGTYGSTSRTRWKGLDMRSIVRFSRSQAIPSAISRCNGHNPPNHPGSWSARTTTLSRMLPGRTTTVATWRPSWSWHVC